MPIILIYIHEALTFDFQIKLVIHIHIACQLVNLSVNQHFYIHFDTKCTKKKLNMAEKKAINNHKPAVDGTQEMQSTP